MDWVLFFLFLCKTISPLSDFIFFVLLSFYLYDEIKMFFFVLPEMFYSPNVTIFNRGTLLQVKKLNFISTLSLNNFSYHFYVYIMHIKQP